MVGHIEGFYLRRNKHKVDNLYELGKQINSVIVALNESELRSDIRDAEVKMNDHQLFRADRQQCLNKGVLLFHAG